MPWARELQSLEETKAFIERAQAAARAGDDFALLGLQRDTLEFVLGTGIHPRNWEVPRFEIGYWCRSSRQRQGYTTEAVRGLTRLAFTALGAERIEIHCDSRNRASRTVAERAGYRLEALLRAEDRSNDGSLRDTVIYALVRGDPGAGPDLGEPSAR
jgi:RimJ/RimL family protein N-acetyltransferase